MKSEGWGWGLIGFRVGVEHPIVSVRVSVEVALRVGLGFKRVKVGVGFVVKGWGWVRV